MYFISYSTPRVKSNVHNKTHQLLCVSNPNLLKTHLFIKHWTSRCLELTEKKKGSTHGIDRNLIHSNHLNLWSVLKASKQLFSKNLIFLHIHLIPISFYQRAVSTSATLIIKLMIYQIRGSSPFIPFSASPSSLPWVTVKNQ